jgi:hypothetical protein
MPTLALSLLHQLLRDLNIPVLPPRLSATSPSLLLLLLETLLDTTLELPNDVRRCATLDDEISVVKCILGVLADDVLAMDLTIIEPIRVVQGQETEIAVIIMGFAVVAKRRGIELRVSRLEPDVLDWSLSVEDVGGDQLPSPIAPDLSCSPIPAQLDNQGDVFQSCPVHDLPFAHRKPGAGDRKGPPIPEAHNQAINGDDIACYPPSAMEVSTTSAQVEDTDRSRRTVMQEMLEEFGLAD